MCATFFREKCKYQRLLCDWDYFCSIVCFEASDNKHECNEECNSYLNIDKVRVEKECAIFQLKHNKRHCKYITSIVGK